jgi:TetR/AcrR family transcriptional regulator, transcriptional repressor for nem operon
LKAAVGAGELPQDFKYKEVGDFILSSLQGAILLSKGRRDTSPKFKRVLFASILR